MDAGLKLAKLSATLSVDNAAAVKAIADASKAFDKFDAALKKVDGDMRQVEKSMGLSVGVINKQAKAVKESETSWIKMAATMYTIRNAAHMVTGAIGGAYEAAADGAKITAAQQFFENAGKSIADYRRATNGMVSDAELMKKANLADSMGISEATFKKLAMVAEASALKTGQSFDYMFNSIIVGTARSSRLLLDNLGIIVNVGQANENYARKQLALAGATNITSAAINKFVEEMSASEKQMAFADEVAIKSQGTLDEYAKATDKTAESFSRFEATVANFADSIKISMAQIGGKVLPVLTQMIEDFRRLFDMQGAGTAFANIVWEIGRAANSLMGNNVGRSRQAVDAETTKMAQRTSMQEYGYKLKGDIEANLRSGENFDNMMSKFVNVGSTGTEALDEMFELFLKVNKELDGFFGTFSKIGPALAGEGPKITATASGPKIKKLEDLEADFQQKHQAMQTKNIVDKAKLDKEIFDLERKAALAWAEFCKDQQLKWAGIDYDMDQAVKKLDEAAQKLKEDQDRAFNDTVGGITSSALAGNGGAAIGNVLGGVASGAVGGPMGAVVGALIAVLGDLLDSLQPLMTLVDYVVGGLGLLLRNGLTPILNTLLPLGPALVALLGAVGMLIRVAISPLTMILNMLITPISMFIVIMAAAVAAAAALVNLLTGIGAAFAAIFMGTSFGTGFEQFTAWLDNGVAAVEGFVNGLLGAVANINNGIVRMIRNIPGLGRFGSIMVAEQFTLPSDEPDPDLPDNTDAVTANTEALRDLQREFRNLPSSYKANGAIFGATDPEGRGPARGSFRQSLRERAQSNQRMRT